MPDEKSRSQSEETQAEGTPFLDCMAQMMFPCCPEMKEWMVVCAPNMSQAFSSCGRHQRKKDTLGACP